MVEKFTSKQKEPEHKAIFNKDENSVLFEYKGPEPEGPRPKKKTD